MANVGQFKVQGLTWVDSSVNDTSIKETTCSLSLKFESKEFPGHTLFIALEKNRNSTYTLFYKKRFHEEASTIADHLPAYFYKLYGEEVLCIFDPYYQDLAKEATWINQKPYYEDDLELYNAITDTADIE